MRPLVNLCFASLAIVATACTDRSTVAPTLPTPLANITSETSTDLWRSIITGETGPGSQYAIYVPRTWSGDVIFYAHGIRDVLNPVGLQDQDSYYTVRDQLGAARFAIAYSSFSENGYALEDAVQRTHQLRGLFASRFGQPAHSYLVGHSLGALAILRLADRYANQYDGAVSICGITGGTTAQLDYVVNVRALFDFFYPGMLPGSPSAPQPGYVLDGVKQNQIIGAVTSNPLGLAVIASTAQTPLEFTNSTELVISLLNALGYHARGADNVLTFTNGKFPVSNLDVTYSARSFILPPLNASSLAGILATVNAQIGRFGADRSAELWAEKNFTPPGDLKVPTITLHNMWDRLVPFFHEGLFAARVTEASATGLLLQRANPAWGYGHCAIPAAAQVQAVTDLATWVTTGVKPAN